jgi:hypothetical protein
VLEFVGQPLAEGNRFGGNVLGGREICEEENHGKRIIEVSQRIDEGGISLLDNVVELDLRDVGLLQPGSIANLAPAQSATNLLCNSLVLAELIEEGFVKEVLDVLGVVEGGCGSRAFGDLLLVAGFARVDTFEKSVGCPGWQ